MITAVIRLIHLLLPNPQTISFILLTGLILMPNPNKETWYDRLPHSERAAVDSLREAGFYVNNKFT